MYSLAASFIAHTLISVTHASSGTMRIQETPLESATSIYHLVVQYTLVYLLVL